MRSKACFVLVVVVALAASGCTPAQRQKLAEDPGPVVAEVGRVGIQIANTFCERAEAQTDDGWVSFVCTVVEVLDDLDSGKDGPRESSSSRWVELEPKPQTKFRVRVKAKYADEFAARHQ